MQEAMQECHTLLRAAILVTQDEARRVIRDGCIAISHDDAGEGRIAAIGSAREMGSWRAARTLDYPAHMVLPGMINAHAHCAMTLMRGYADDLPLLEWLSRRIFPLESRLDAESVRLGSLLGQAEMLASGITAFMDMYLFGEAVLEAAGISGMRAIGGEVVFDSSGPASAGAAQSLEMTRELARKYAGHPRIEVAVNPHSVYATSPETLRRCAALAGELGLSLHMHVAESAAESALSLEKWGLRPLGLCADAGLLEGRCVFAHMVDLDDMELDLAARAGVGVAHCPSSNMKLASGTARVPEMLARGIAVGLGTDGAASNNCLNLFAEMGRAALLHKCAGADPTLASAQSVLDMATTGGAAAIGRPGLGRLAAGHPADLAVLDLSRPNLLPMHNPISQAVYAASGHEVVMTMVGGEILYDHGNFSRFDMARLAAEAARAAALLTRKP